MANVTITMTIDQAAAMTRMLDLAVRIHLGQFREIEYMARTGELKHQSGRRITGEECDILYDEMAKISSIFGWTPNASFGIGSQCVSNDAHRGYEIMKVAQKAVAEHRDPNPTGIRGVDRDGLSVRYTSDPAPVAVVVAQRKD